MPARRIVSPYGGGARSLPGATPMPVPPADGPQMGPWQVAVVRVEETPTGDASGEEPPYTTTDRRRPIDLPEVAGNDGQALLADPPPPPPPRAGVMKFDGPLAGLHMRRRHENHYSLWFMHRLTRMVSSLLLGHRSHLTVTLLALSAQMCILQIQIY